MTTRHTVGPWSLDHDYKTAIQSGSKHVAMINFYNSPDSETRVTDAEHYANAHLIAAAPDLLAALQLIAASAGWDHLSGEVQDAVVNSISKAEGRS